MVPLIQLLKILVKCLQSHSLLLKKVNQSSGVSLSSVIQVALHGQVPWGGGGTQVFLVLTTSVQQVYVIPSATPQRLCNLLQLSKDDSKVHTLAIEPDKSEGLVEPDKSEDGTSDPVSEVLTEPQSTSQETQPERRSKREFSYSI